MQPNNLIHENGRYLLVEFEIYPHRFYTVVKRFGKIYRVFFTAYQLDRWVRKIKSETNYWS